MSRCKRRRVAIGGCVIVRVYVCACVCSACPSRQIEAISWRDRSFKPARGLATVSASARSCRQPVALRGSEPAGPRRRRRGPRRHVGGEQETRPVAVLLHGNAHPQSQRRGVSDLLAG